MSCQRGKPIAPSALENTPKRAAKTSSTANLSLSTTSEIISPEPQLIKKLEVTTTGGMTTQGLKDTIVMTGIITTDPEVIPLAARDHNSTAKVDTIIDPTRMRRTLIDSPKLTISHLNSRAGPMT
jgi:hypothetical protein